MRIAWSNRFQRPARWPVCPKCIASATARHNSAWPPCHFRFRGTNCPVRPLVPAPPPPTTRVPSYGCHWHPRVRQRRASRRNAFCNAPRVSCAVAMPAGSAGEPIITKSLYISSRRSMPKPRATKSSSASRAWVINRSPSQCAHFSAPARCPRR